MTNEQVELSKTSAADIPDEKIFTPVPLAARLSSGVENTKNLILRMRENVSKQALEASLGTGP